MKIKRISLISAAAIVVLLIVSYIVFYFNSLTFALWGLGFSKNDIVTSFNTTAWYRDTKIILLNSKTRIAILELDKNALGFWRRSPNASTFDIVSKTDKKNRYAMESYTIASKTFYVNNVYDPKFQSHFLLAGIASKKWNLEKIGNPKDSRFNLRIRCFNVTGGQIFLADTTSNNGMNSDDIERYIERYEKTQSAKATSRK